MKIEHNVTSYTKLLLFYGTLISFLLIHPVFGTDNSQIPDRVKQKLNIALIMEFANSPVSVNFIKGVKEQAQESGVNVSIYDANFDPIKQVDLVNNAIHQKVDAIMLSLGKPEPLTPVIQMALSKGIKVVAFDCELKIPGLTIIEQNDYEMARLTLEAMVKDIGGKGNIVKIWVPGFAPMEKRQVVYDSIMKANPDIKEIAAFGVANNTTMLQTQEQMAAILKQHKKGTIQAVWASWDEFAKGAAKAIQAAGRDEIKVYGIDITNEDLQIIQTPRSPWIVTTAVDMTTNGKIHLRLMLLELAGEPLPDRVKMSPVLIHRNELPEQVITLETLNNFVKNWGDHGQYFKPWMKTMNTQKNQ